MTKYIVKFRDKDGEWSYLSNYPQDLQASKEIKKASKFCEQYRAKLVKDLQPKNMIIEKFECL